MNIFLWNRGVVNFDDDRSGDTARAKSRIYYASNNVLAAKIPAFSKLFFLDFGLFL